MSRLQIFLTVQTADPGTHVVSAVPGASINVFARNSDGSAGAASSVFQFADPGISTTLTQPLVADAEGRIPGWLDPGDYLIQVSGTGFTTYSLSYDVPGGGGDTAVPEILDSASATDPVLEIGITGETVQRLVTDADASMHWSDGTNPSQLKLLLDTTRYGNYALGFYPENGNDTTSLNFLGGDTTPSLGGTAGGLMSMFAGSSSAGWSLAGDVFGATSSVYAQAYPDGCRLVMGGQGNVAEIFMQIASGTEYGIIQLRAVEAADPTWDAFIVSQDRTHSGVGSNYQWFKIRVDGTLTWNTDSSGSGPDVSLSAPGGPRLECSGAMGMWGVMPPGTKPSTPVTLGNVISLLQSYGMCA